LINHEDTEAVAFVVVAAAMVTGRYRVKGTRRRACRPRGLSDLRRHNPCWITAVGVGRPVSRSGQPRRVAGILGNALAMKAYREGILPSPDGTTLAKVAWKHVALTGVDGAFVPARATAVQIMVTDSKKYAATSGWGGRAIRWGKPVDEARLKACFSCHAAKVKGHDLVFARYAP